MEPERRPAGAGGFSPVIVFAVLLILVVTGAVLLMTGPEPPRPNPASSPQATPSPTTHRLTDAEAIARLAYLDKVRIASLEQRDVTLLGAAVHPEGPASSALSKSIKTLLRDGVRLDHQGYDVLESHVIANTPNQIRVKQTVVIDVQFRDAENTRITKGSGAEKQILIATLRRLQGEWLFFDGQIVRTEPVRR